MVSETLEDDWYENEGGYSLRGNHIEEDIEIQGQVVENDRFDCVLWINGSSHNLL